MRSLPLGGTCAKTSRSIHLYAGYAGTPTANKECLADWVHDLRTADPSEMRIPELAQHVQELKLDKEYCGRLFEENRTWKERALAALPHGTF